MLNPEPADLILWTRASRYIVEAPANICTPSHIARVAEAIAAAAPDVFTCRILEQADCEAMRMGCYLGVTACSAEPPKFIHMTYKPSGERPAVGGLLGAGVTLCMLLLPGCRCVQR